MINFNGIIVPMLTPMNEDESINEAELKNQVNRLIDAGVQGLFPFGTNGEGYILSDKEKYDALDIIVKEVNHRVPVIAGTGCIGTLDTIKVSKMAKKIGADALSIITPSFASASQDEIYEHFKRIAEEVDIPILLYNIPARTNNAIAPATVKRLSKIKNIVGVKDSSGNFDNMLQYIEQTRDREDFVVLSGNDSLILWNLLAGGQGGVAGCANVYPEVMVSIYKEFLAGNIDKARDYQDSIRSFRNVFKFGNANTIVKKAVSKLGQPVGECRAPFNKLSDEGLKALELVLKENKAKGMK